VVTVTLFGPQNTLAAAVEYTLKISPMVSRRAPEIGTAGVLAMMLKFNIRCVTDGRIAGTVSHGAMVAASG
jgi:hypothetical protein